MINYDKNNFILLLQKNVDPYEYMVDWEKISRASLPEDEDFESLLNMEDITDAGGTPTIRVCKAFEMKN